MSLTENFATNLDLVDPEYMNRIDILAAATTPPPELDFVLPGLAAGTVGLLIAPGGAGKSYFGLEIASTIATGQDMCGVWSSAEADTITRGQVLVVVLEDPSSVINHRVHHIAGHCDAKSVVALVTNLILLSYAGKNFTFLKRTGNKWCESSALASLRRKIIASGQRPRLVIFDTLNRCLGSASENSSRDIALVLTVLEKFCKSMGCAVLLVHHSNRAAVRSESGLETSASRGSSVLTDNCRFVLNMQVMTSTEAAASGIPERERRNWVAVAGSKCNYGPCLPKFWLKRGKGGLLEPTELPLHD